MAHRVLMGLTRTLPKRVKEVKKPFENLLVLDFEATCVKDQILTPQEIIEFPCLVLSTEDWEVKDVFHQYVKPRVHPQLSNFCTELTGIMQETVEGEPYFPEVFSAFCEWVREGQYFEEKDRSAFVTCGDWDLRVMLPEQCALDKIEVPSYMHEWINLKTACSAATKYYPRSMNDMLNHLKMSIQGRLHSGIDDTHNMVRIIQTLAIQHKAEFNITSKLNEKFAPLT